MKDTREEERINPGHTTARSLLRFFGPVILITGIVFVVVGFVSIVSFSGPELPRFNGFEEHMLSEMKGPRFAWCPFVGMPLIFVGVVMTGYGYMGKVARYAAGEIAPVGRDTFNYLAKGTEEGVKTIAKAVGEGLGTAVGGKTEVKVRCHKCNTLVYEGAKFCPECAAPLGKSKKCPGCGELNDPDAKLCDECGHRFE